MQLHRWQWRCPHFNPISRSGSREYNGVCRHRKPTIKKGKKKKAKLKAGWALPPQASSWVQHLGWGSGHQHHAQGLHSCGDKAKGNGIYRWQSLASTWETTAICTEVEEQEGPGAARVPRQAQSPGPSPGPSPGAGEPPPVQPQPCQAGPEVPAGQRGSLQECSTLLSLPFPRATRDPSSCWGSGAGDDPGGDGLNHLPTAGLLTAAPAQEVPISGAGVIAATPQRACVCSGGSPGSSSSFGVAESVPTGGKCRELLLLLCAWLCPPQGEPVQMPEPQSVSVWATGEHQSRKYLDREMITGTPSCLLSQALQPPALQPTHAVDAHSVGQGLVGDEVGLFP